MRLVVERLARHLREQCRTEILIPDAEQGARVGGACAWCRGDALDVGVVGPVDRGGDADAVAFGEGEVDEGSVHGVCGRGLVLEAGDEEGVVGLGEGVVVAEGVGVAEEAVVLFDVQALFVGDADAFGEFLEFEAGAPLAPAADLAAGYPFGGVVVSAAQGGGDFGGGEGAGHGGVCGRGLGGELEKGSAAKRTREECRTRRGS